MRVFEGDSTKSVIYSYTEMRPRRIPLEDILKPFFTAHSPVLTDGKFAGKNVEPFCFGAVLMVGGQLFWISGNRNKAGAKTKMCITEKYC